MGITVASLRSAISTDTGEQNFTTSDMGGLTPSAAMFLLPRATADGTAADHAAMGIGFATATDAQGFATWTDGHGVGTSVTTKRQSDSNCIGLNTPGALNPTWLLQDLLPAWGRLMLSQKAH